MSAIEQASFEEAISPQLHTIAQFDIPAHEKIRLMVRATNGQVAERYVDTRRQGRAISAYLLEWMNDTESGVEVTDLESLRAGSYANMPEHASNWRYRNSADHHARLTGKYALNYALSAYSAQHGGPDHSLFKAHGIVRGSESRSKPSQFEEVLREQPMAAAHRDLARGPISRFFQRFRKA